MSSRKLERFQSNCETDTRQLERNLNEFNNETSRLKIRVAKTKVMLIFYLNFKATNLKYNSRRPRKLDRVYETIRQIQDNSTVIPSVFF